ncbi:MAG: alpha/beta-type small acid-soluble spore protein [Christensenellales bacterium]
MASNSNSSNTFNSAEQKQQLNNMKYEVANSLGVNLKQGYNGDLTSKDAGSVGGEMVRRLIERAENNMK